ncbi:hypothetical protein [Peptacetobacter sp.]|uniref:hypothetical protein n=1 Tax=Peptacetobacter sp. TaxID=2991975 RepID=UPI003AB471B1
MDEKTLDTITKEILASFHNIVDELNEAVEDGKPQERRKQAYELREKIFSEVLLRYNTLVWKLYKELELNKELRKEVKFHE